MVSLKAVILVGDARTTLSPVTNFLPKAMIPVRHNFVTDPVFEFLNRYGVRDLMILTSTEDYPAISNYRRMTCAGRSSTIREKSLTQPLLQRWKSERKSR